MSHPPADTPSPTPSAAPRINLPVNPEWEVHPTQVKAWMDAREELLLLDCRRQDEWDTTHIAGARLVPLDQLEAQAHTLADWQQRRVVVYCHHGMRSLRATKILRKHGFTNTHSMAGGTEIWSQLIDPSIKRY